MILKLLTLTALAGLAAGHLTVDNCGRRYAYQEVLAYLRAHHIAVDKSLVGRNFDGSPLAADDTASPDLNIIGGRLAGDNEFPWMASLQIRHMLGGRSVHKCGATILNEEWLLTAAHCMSSMVPQDYVVYTGGRDLLFPHRDNHGTYHNVSRLIKHINFRMPAVRDDIALIRLEEPIELSIRTGLNGVCLPPALQEYAGQAQVVGYGRQWEFDRRPQFQLKSANVSIVGDVPCRVGLAQRIRPEMMCATTLLGFRDTCAGDSGGPMIKYGADDRAYQVGITSWGRGWCGTPLNPGVYTQVSRYIPWITSFAYRLVPDPKPKANSTISI